MSILTILKYDDPALRGKAAAVKRINKSILRLLDDMLDTMRAAEGVGLAANQIGVLQRVVVIDIGEGPIELINPVIVGHAGTEVGIEACLSVPGLMGEVERAERITIKALDRQANPCGWTLTECWPESCSTSWITWRVSFLSTALHH